MFYFRYNTPGFFYIESADDPKDVLVIKKETSEPYVLSNFSAIFHLLLNIYGNY